MRFALVITFLGLVGCTRTAPPPPDDCPCGDGRVCCPGTQICVVPGGGEGCPLPGSPPPDMAWVPTPPPDFSTGDMTSTGDLASTPDMTQLAHFDFDPPALSFGDRIISRDLPQLTVHVSNPNSAFIDGLQIATGVGTGATRNLATSFDPLAAPFVFDGVGFHPDACGPILGAGSSCKLYLVFRASQEIPVSAKITIADGKVAAPVVTLEGRGIDPAAL